MQNPVRSRQYCILRQVRVLRCTTCIVHVVQSQRGGLLATETNKHGAAAVQA